MLGRFHHESTLHHLEARRPVEHLATGLGGQLFGDRGYISQALHDIVLGQGLALLTAIRKNMKKGSLAAGELPGGAHDSSSGCIVWS